MSVKASQNLTNAKQQAHGRRFYPRSTSPVCGQVQNEFIPYIMSNMHPLTKHTVRHALPAALTMSEGKRGREAEAEHRSSKKAHVEEEETDAPVVCGIDLGATCMRYAFAFTRRPTEILVSCSFSLAFRELHACICPSPRDYGKVLHIRIVIFVLMYVYVYFSRGSEDTRVSSPARYTPPAYWSTTAANL